MIIIDFHQTTNDVRTVFGMCGRQRHLFTVAVCVRFIYLCHLITLAIIAIMCTITHSGGRWARQHVDYLARGGFIVASVTTSLIPIGVVHGIRRVVAKVLCEIRIRGRRVQQFFKFFTQHCQHQNVVVFAVVGKSLVDAGLCVEDRSDYVN